MGLKQGLNVPSNLDPCFLKEDIGFQWIVIIELLIYWNCPQIFVLLFFLFLSLFSIYLLFSLFLLLSALFVSSCASIGIIDYCFLSPDSHESIVLVVFTILKKKIEKHRRLKFVEVLPRTTMKKLTDTTKHWQLLYLMI